jgi:hypothetical protein
MHILLSLLFIISSWDIICFMYVIRSLWLMFSRTHDTSPERRKNESVSDATGLEPTGYVHERDEIIRMFDCKVAGT